MANSVTRLNVLVVDDEPLARGRLVRQLRTISWVDRIDEAANVGDALARINLAAPDIMLLDIQMPDGTGFDLLRQMDRPVSAVVFVTAFDDQALAAFDACAVDYVTKPIEPGRLHAALDRARNTACQRASQDRVNELEEVVAALRARAGRPAEREPELWVRHNGDFVRITSERISHISAERDYVRIHVGGRDYLHHENLASLERLLPAGQFRRIHRSAIIRIDAVERVKRGKFSSLTVVLTGGRELRVGRTYAAELRNLLASRTPLALA